MLACDMMHIITCPIIRSTFAANNRKAWLINPMEENSRSAFFFRTLNVSLLHIIISQDLVARDLPVHAQLLEEAATLPELILTEVITSPVFAYFTILLDCPIGSGGKPE
jgi:hypothetical protein